MLTVYVLVRVWNDGGLAVIQAYSNESKAKQECGVYNANLDQYDNSQYYIIEVPFDNTN